MTLTNGWTVHGDRWRYFRLNPCWQSVAVTKFELVTMHRDGHRSSITLNLLITRRNCAYHKVWPLVVLGSLRISSNQLAQHKIPDPLSDLELYAPDLGIINLLTSLNGIAHGGIAMLIKNSTPHKQIQLNTSLQAIAVRTTLHKTVTVCYIEIQQFRFCRFYHSTSSTSLNPWRF